MKEYLIQIVECIIVLIAVLLFYTFVFIWIPMFLGMIFINENLNIMAAFTILYFIYVSFRICSGGGCNVFIFFIFFSLPAGFIVSYILFVNFMIGTPGSINEPYFHALHSHVLMATIVIISSGINIYHLRKRVEENTADIMLDEPDN